MAKNPGKVSTRTFKQQQAAMRQKADLDFRAKNPAEWRKMQTTKLVTGVAGGLAEAIPATTQAISTVKYNKRAEENIAKAKYAAMPKVSVGYYYTGGNTSVNSTELEQALNSVDKIVTNWEAKY